MQTRIHQLYRPIEERKHDFQEVERQFTEAEIRSQMERCHNCGIPFSSGSHSVRPLHAFSGLLQPCRRLWEHWSLEDCAPLRMSDAREEK